MVADICQLNLDSTPVKADDIISFVVTPNVKRSLFLEPDENSDLSKDDHVSITSDANKPTSTKRRRGKGDTHFACFKRSKSSDDVKTAVNILAENDDMIADGSRGYVLPTVTGKHHDLKSITPTTLADVINGGYNDVINSYRIIDCRYRYEYEGGHVRGAENRYLHETILSLLQQPTSDRNVIIFHCEFSSERGPKMLRFLRSKDRELNKENYPTLSFPEMYLLDGGYKAFFNEHPQLCDPISYRPMLHSEHSADLRHFRTSSKSWTAGEKRRFARKAMRF
jgi:rhodanese-related sulfurtransferase